MAGVVLDPEIRKAWEIDQRMRATGQPDTVTPA